MKQDKIYRTSNSKIHLKGEKVIKNLIAVRSLNKTVTESNSPHTLDTEETSCWNFS